MMKITLTVNGREVTLSEEELICILEKHFNNETEEVQPKTPREEEWFSVNVLEIDRELFSEKREKYWEENARKMILEAFSEVDANPERYARTFETFMPKKVWEVCVPVREYQLFCHKLGGHMADWVEQALEWAQRIANGESWDTICNQADTANWERLILWKNGFVRIVGGSQKMKHHDSAVYIYHNEEYGDADKIRNVVPLVARYM